MKTVPRHVVLLLVVILGTLLGCSAPHYFVVVNHREEPIHIVYMPGRFESRFSFLSRPEISTSTKFKKLDRYVPVDVELLWVNEKNGRLTVPLPAGSAVKIGVINDNYFCRHDDNYFCRSG